MIMQYDLNCKYSRISLFVLYYELAPIFPVGWMLSRQIIGAWTLQLDLRQWIVEEIDSVVHLHLGIGPWIETIWEFIFDRNIGIKIVRIAKIGEKSAVHGSRLQFSTFGALIRNRRTRVRAINSVHFRKLFTVTLTNLVKIHLELSPVRNGLLILKFTEILDISTYTKNLGIPKLAHARSLGVRKRRLPMPLEEPRRYGLSWSIWKYPPFVFFRTYLVFIDGYSAR